MRNSHIMYLSIAKYSFTPGPNLEYYSMPVQESGQDVRECFFWYALPIQQLGGQAFQLRLMSKLSNSLFLPAFIQTNLLQYHMQFGNIANIKVPNGFIFNIQQIIDVREVAKDSSFCKVRLFKYREEKYALKVIRKKEIPGDKYEEEYRRVANQIRLLYELSHPSIIKLFYHDETGEEIRMLMEYGGTRLSSHFKDTYQNQDEVRRITKQILQVLKYVHEEGYIHRDLEPTNILVNKQLQTIKLIDFGFVDEVAFRRTKIGSYHYMAPQITGDNTYNQKVDIWSLGIIVYQMLHKDIPFCSRKQFDVNIFQLNKKKLDIQFYSEISQQAKKFIRRMLVIDPEQRASASQLLRHQFIEPQQDLSLFDREGTEKKTHKFQYIREVEEVKEEETIEQLQGRLKRTISQLFTCFHHQKETLSDVFKTYKQILTHSIQQKQKRLK